MLVIVSLSLWFGVVRGSPAVEVYHQGEEGFPCIRAPATIAVQNGVLLAFAAARCYTGDNCYPKPTSNESAGKAKQYSAHVVKRSVDGGLTWSKITEIHKNNASEGCGGSPESGIFFDSTTSTAITIFNSNSIGNSTTGLTLWQSESTDAGLTWSTPHPLIIPSLTAEDVHDKTHIPPGGGIQLRAGKHQGRLLVVLILEAHCTEDVVIYSDNSGASWEMSTRLPHNGEAQLAELAADQVLFDGRSSEAGNKRGVALSTDGGATFGALHFTDDATSGVSCLASLLAIPLTNTTVASTTPQCSPSTYMKNASAKQSGGSILKQMFTTLADDCCAACRSLAKCGAWTLATAHNSEPKKKTTCYLMSALTAPTTSCAWCTSGISSTPPPPPSPAGNISSLYFSHPSDTDRTKGVVLRSNDGARTWTKFASATPEEPTRKFGYSSLTLLQGGGVGLTFETSGDSCTAATSACNIMYRNVSVSAP
jgi:hypothetical protein